MQANLAVLPKEQAYDFLLFCQRNPRPCPLIEVTDVGSPEPVGVAPGADLRTDIPQLPHLQGRRARGRGDRRRRRTGATTSSRSCSAARSRSSGRCSRRASPVARRARQERRDVATSIECRPAGVFHGPMVVSMRPIPSGAALEGGDRERALSRRARRAGPHRRSRRRSASTTSTQPRLGRRAALRAGRRTGVLGVRRDAAGGRARVEAAVHDHAQPRPHVHHRPAERGARRVVSSRVSAGGRPRRSRWSSSDEISVEVNTRVRALEYLIQQKGDARRRRNGAGVPLAARLLRSARRSATTRSCEALAALLARAGRARRAAAAARRRAAVLLRRSRARLRPRGAAARRSASRRTSWSRCTAARRVPRVLHRLHAGAAVPGRACRSGSRIPRLDTPRTKTPPGSVGDRRHAVLHLLGREPGRLLGARPHAGAALRSGAERADAAAPRRSRCASARSIAREYDRDRRRPWRRATYPAGDRVIRDPRAAARSRPCRTSAGPVSCATASRRRARSTATRSCSRTASSATTTARPALECTLHRAALRGRRRRARSR